MANKNYGHIVVIVILVLVFSGLLILTTSNRNISMNYNFVDTVEINSYDDLSNIEIGTVSIKNDGIISSRVDLGKYVVCQLSSYYGDNYYEVEYRGASTVRGKAELFDYDYYQRRIDVSPGEEIKLYMTVYPYAIQKYYIEQYDLYNRTLPFYLFEIGGEDDDYYYNYCDIARAEDAIKTIYINMNLDPEEVKNVPYEGVDVR